MKRKFSSAFKAQVGLEALKERETLRELSARFEAYPTVISKWKSDFMTSSAMAFEKPGQGGKPVWGWRSFTP